MQHAVQADFVPFDAHGWKVGIVMALFNRDITDALHASARKRAADYKIDDGDIETVQVAGSVEIPLVLQQMAASGKYQVLLAIGCIIQGATPHFDFVAKFVTDGILRVQLDHQTPIGFGVLTCATEVQAVERSGLGGEHLDAVLQQAHALKQLSQK